ncbi:putative microtubule-associated protein, MAP65/Ase1/PRC1 [Helianthus annuus]|nr:putative microtubule-associated protein, MAP65/Ase1/PRC1 [Helianthus annuus]
MATRDDSSSSSGLNLEGVDDVEDFVWINVDKKASSLKGQLMMVTPLVEDLKSKKEERIKQLADIKSQIEKINGEILGYNQITSTVSSLNLEEKDLSIRKLGEY